MFLGSIYCNSSQHYILFHNKEFPIKPWLTDLENATLNFLYLPLIHFGYNMNVPVCLDHY